MDGFAAPPNMSPYEKEALRQVERWKHADLNWLQRRMRVVGKAVDAAGTVVMKTPGVGPVLEKSVDGAISVANDLANRTVRTKAILKKYRKSGHDVETLSDITMLDLESVEKVSGWLDAKYKSVAAGEGGATGFAGLPGIPMDILAILTLSLRAVGEYATHYGFDINTQDERLFAMNVLGLSASTTDATKGAFMAQLVRIANKVAKRKTWEELEKHVFVRMLQEIAKAIGIRLTKAKLAQVIPVVGAGVGAGFNAHFIGKICTASLYLYRERFLARKYGPELITAP